jgi:hypothetical protein
MNTDDHDEPLRQTVEEEKECRVTLGGCMSQSAEGGEIQRFKTSELDTTSTVELPAELLQKVDRVIRGLQKLLIHLGISYLLGVLMICYADILVEFASLYVVLVLASVVFPVCHEIRPPLRELIQEWEPLREVVRYFRQNIYWMVLHPIRFCLGGWPTLSENSINYASVLDDLKDVTDTIQRFLFCQPKQSDSSENCTDVEEGQCIPLFSEASAETEVG